jgi:hypothetical protein
MKRVSRRRGRVAIDTVPLPDKVIGMPTKKGKVSRLRGRYYLTVARRRVEIPTGPVISADQVRKLVGKEVHVAYSGRRKSEIVAIGTWPTPERPRPIRCYWILCYIPAPDMISRIRPDIRNTLIGKMVRQKVITQKLARMIRSGLR